MLLIAENIYKSYGEKMLLNGVSLNIEEKEKIGIIGVNGCGKTTLLKILANRLESDKGDVNLIGKTKISYLPQDLELNEDNNICPINIPGEICVAGDGVSLGYINNSETTSKVFIENPFGKGKIYKTGDIGKINSKGELKYIDRKDSQIKIRGLRVELSEIEKQILSTIKLKGCTVIYKKDKGTRLFGKA